MREILKIFGFTEMEFYPKYTKRNTLDFFMSLAYFVVSSYCVCWDEASLIVLMLNGFCLCKKIIKNSIQSSKMTEMIRGETNLQKESTGKYFFFMAAAVELAIGTLGGVLFILLWFETNIIITKAVSILMLFVVFCDDVVDILINTYQASITPFR